MKALMILPRQHHYGGNWVHASRLQKGLHSPSLQVSIKTIDLVTENDYRNADVIHSFNAFSTGRFIFPIAEKLNKPLIVTLTGTDINEHIHHEDRRADMLNVIDYSTSVVFLTSNARDKLLAFYPHLKPKCRVITIGVQLPLGAGKTRADFGISENDFVFLLLAGIRAVKRPLDAFSPLLKLHESYPNVRFLLAGPVHEDMLFQEMLTKFKNAEFARYLGSIEYDQVPDLYRCSDVVLNTSASEGLSHSLLEAMTLGMPVLASAVPGNTDLITDGVNGLLYHDENEFLLQSERLYNNAALRNFLGANGEETAKKQYSATLEVEAYRQLYESSF